MFLCDFLCGFLLARPLIFKSGPGSYSVVIFQRSIPNNNTLSREGSTTYDSGGSNPATSERIRLAVCLLPAAAGFVPTLGTISGYQRKKVVKKRVTLLEETIDPAVVENSEQLLDLSTLWYP